MFEGNHLTAQLREGTAGTQADEELHTLEWSDLVARLTAARDLRAALATAPVAATAHASFDASAAHYLRHASISADPTGKRDVNLVASVNGKGDSAKQMESAMSAHPAPRGNS